MISMPEIGWPEIRVHPRYFLGEEEMAVAALWWQYRGGGLGNGPLPFAGGAADQPSLVMDAFGACNGAEAELKPDR